MDSSVEEAAVVEDATVLDPVVEDMVVDRDKVVLNIIKAT